MEADFSGYATKAGLECADGRTITAEAFKHMDGMKVPLVWMHGHKEISNLLGHVLLEARHDGVYAYGYLNSTKGGQEAKVALQHEDINQMSIWANQLVEKTIGRVKQVLHGKIKEVSLVLSGANPGAKIDFVRLAHGDDVYEDREDEAIITTGLAIQHGGIPDGVTDEKVVEHAADSDTVLDVYETLNEDQKKLFTVVVNKALEEGKVAHTDITDDAGTSTDVTPKTDEGDLEHQEGSGEVTHNIFDQSEKVDTDEKRHTLSHDDMRDIFATAKKTGSLKQALEEKALAHGITNISLLFPDARALKDRPDFLQRRIEWVDKVLGAVGKSPFAKIKHLWADLTLDEARAKGYVTGAYKEEEWFDIAQRSTGPTTIYKKQKLDRDTILDITDFDIVAWLWGEIEMMLKEELARAILISDGRANNHADKIKDPAGANTGDGIRSIYKDHDLFVTTLNVNLGDANSTYNEVLDAIIRGRRFYKGKGMPTFYTTEVHLSEFLLLKDEANSNRPLYASEAELATRLRVKEIVTVEPMETVTDLVGIIVNLSDYNLGTNKGGQLTQFDDFDIDYNQYKYLLETRLSGSLVELNSAIIIKSVTSTDTLVEPQVPTFVSATGVVTIPSQTGVVYKNAAGSTLSSGAQTALAAGTSTTIYATPAATYYFSDNQKDDWTFKRPAA